MRSIAKQQPRLPVSEHFNKLKMYVLIRKDILTDVQCGVQASHALSWYIRDYIQYDPNLIEWIWNHHTLIFLEANEEEIHRKKVLFPSWVGFKEPDLDDIETAVAFSPVSPERGMELFGDLKLI